MRTEPRRARLHVEESGSFGQGRLSAFDGEIRIGSLFFMDESRSHNIKLDVPYDDLRGWIAEADKLGEVRLAEGYDWEEQIGMAALSAG